MPVDESLKRLYEAAVRTHADGLYRLAWRLTGSRDLADELVQEVFLQAWKGLGSLNDADKIRPWMVGILYRQYQKQWPRERKFADVPAAELPGTDRSAAVVVELKETRREVQAAIAALPDEFRLPILMVTMEGLSTAEAADVLGWPRGTVLSRLHRGRERLKSALQGLLETPETVERKTP